MALTDVEVEKQLTQRRLDEQDLKLKYSNLLGSVNSIQNSLTNIIIPQLNATTGAIGSGSGGAGLDTVIVNGGVVHQLKTLFQSIVTFASSIILSSLTTSRPLKLDNTGTVISGKIDLAAPSTDIQNTLGVANGGTGAVSLTLDSVLLGNGTSAIQTLAGITGSLSLSVSSSSITYKDGSGMNQTITVVTAVTLTANAFTKGVRTT